MERPSYLFKPSSVPIHIKPWRSFRVQFALEEDKPSKGPTCLNVYCYAHIWVTDSKVPIKHIDTM